MQARAEFDERVLRRVADDALGIAALLHRLDRLPEDLAVQRNALVGGAEVLAAAIGDAALSFESGAVLRYRGYAPPLFIADGVDVELGRDPLRFTRPVRRHAVVVDQLAVA